MLSARRYGANEFITIIVINLLPFGVIRDERPERDAASTSAAGSPLTLTAAGKSIANNYTVFISII